MRPGSVVERFHLATTAAVSLVVVADPSALLRRGEDWETWLPGHQRVDRVMREVAPVLFLSTGAWALLAAGVAARQHRPVAVGCRLVAVACVGSAIAVTLRVNEPVNEEIRGWRPQDTPAPEWRETRARWERGHRVRRGLLALGAAATVAGLTTGSATR